MNHNIAVILVAGGKGMRVHASSISYGEEGDNPLPKQYQLLNGCPIIMHSLLLLLDHALIDRLVVVIGKEDALLFDQAYAPYKQRYSKSVEMVIGGADRRGSVYAGLQHLSASTLPPSHILVHDAARPLASLGLWDKAIASLLAKGSVVPIRHVQEALKRVNPDTGEILSRLDRDGLGMAQTPQGFGFDALLKAHNQVDKNAPAEDDAALMEAMGERVFTIMGEPNNIKITYAEDIAQAKKLLSFLASPLSSRGEISLQEGKNHRGNDFRIGHGFDLHRLVENKGSDKAVILGGIKLESKFYLEGHSDADCLLHALTDALLGAIAAGDIGDFFSPLDPQWKNASSHIFLKRALEEVTARGASIVNIDITLLAETPKIAPYRLEIRENLAKLLNLDQDRISLKATTMEGVDAIGTKTAIACHAIALIRS